MKFNWKIAAGVAVASGVVYAVYRAEHEASQKELAASGASPMTVRALSMTAPASATLVEAQPAASKPVLGDLTPTAATGTAMVGGAVLYSLLDIVKDVVSASITKRL